MTMLEIDARPAAGMRRERDLDLAGLPEVGLVAPLVSDLPRDDEPMRRLPDQTRRPRPFRAVSLASVPAAAEPGLDDGLLESAFADVMAPRPPRIELFGEHFEGALCACIDGDGFSDRDSGRFDHGHHS